MIFSRSTPNRPWQVIVGFIILEILGIVGGACVAERLGFNSTWLLAATGLLCGVAGYLSGRVGGSSWLAGATVAATGYLVMAVGERMGTWQLLPVWPFPGVGLDLLACAIAGTLPGFLGGWFARRPQRDPLDAWFPRRRS